MTTKMDDLTCKELVETLTEYLEGAMDPAEHGRFEDHLERCAKCRSYLEQFRHTIELSGRVSEQELEPELREGLLDAFRGWKREANL